MRLESTETTGRKIVRGLACGLGLGAVGWGLYRFFSRKSEAEKKPTFPTTATAEKKFGNGKRDIVEESSWESFPASDPPSSGHFT